MKSIHYDLTMNMKERMRGRLKGGLKIEVEDKNEESFVANGEGWFDSYHIYLTIFCIHDNYTYHKEHS